MKLTLDPMPALRAAAKGKVNAWFNQTAQPHLDAAYAAKRAAAAAGAPYPDWLVQEASLRGTAPDALAALILSKPDTTGQRELARQRALLALDTAQTPADLANIVDNLRQT